MHPYLNLQCCRAASLGSRATLAVLCFLLGCDHGIATGSAGESQQGNQLTQYIARLSQPLDTLQPTYLRVDQVRGALVQDEPPEELPQPGEDSPNNELLHFGALETPDGTRLQIDISPYPRFVLLRPEDIVEPVAESQGVHLSPHTLSMYQNCPLYRLGHNRLERTAVYPPPTRLWTFEDDVAEGFGLVQTVGAAHSNPLWVARACIAEIADPLLDNGVPDANTVDASTAHLAEGLMIAYPPSEPQRLKAELLGRGWTVASANPALAAFFNRYGVAANAWYAIPNEPLPVALLPRSAFETLYNNGAITPYLNQRLLPSKSQTRLGLSPQVSRTAWLHIHDRHNSFHRFSQQLHRATYNSKAPDNVMVVTGYDDLTGVLLLTMLEWNAASQSYQRFSRPNGGSDLRTAFPLAWGYYRIDRELGEMLRWLRAEPVSNWIKLNEFEARARTLAGKQRFRFRMTHRVRDQVYVWTYLVIDVPFNNNINAAEVVSFYPRDLPALEAIEVADRNGYIDQVALDLSSKRQQGEHVPAFVFDGIKDYLARGFGLPPGL